MTEPSHGIRNIGSLQASHVRHHQALTVPTQHDATPGVPARSAWIGGHGTEPYEQNTQQSPDLGFNFVPQPVHT
jgi:hypothetical protein